MLDSYFEEKTKAFAKATQLGTPQVIQSLWSGYGEILRTPLPDGIFPSIIVKHIDLSPSPQHPRGWNSGFSHQRKLKSYEIEARWYSQWSEQCPAGARIPKFLGFAHTEHAYIIVMEDLDAQGFPIRKSEVERKDLYNCIKWLAQFHGNFINQKPEGLWENGCYWHLDTRPEELEKMANSPLKTFAKAIDEKLKNTSHPTLLHGDAKLANFCFGEDGSKVAVVDFQYIGGGCGMKDLAYFLSSCLDENELFNSEKPILDFYFKELRNGISSKDIDLNKLEKEWRELYPYAWADFVRFLEGWSPGHWKLNNYAKEKTDRVITELQNT
ncbi:phosphotransferase (plasmid) [Fulvitalea axinellae]|uniref:Phosphotransferase n=1 Tax=Fulvitalea axinellae TaxID=1182444 RepID=A0AAU9DGU4_9BACT|nr:phosphotransferase [Fulvitalea axinellae]